MWLGGVQINGLVHLVAEKNEMDPSLSIQMLHFSDESWRGCWCLHPPRGSLHRHGWLQPRVHVYWRIQSLRLPLLQNEEWTFLFSHQKQRLLLIILALTEISIIVQSLRWYGLDDKVISEDMR